MCDPYLYENTEVLKNKLDIRTQDGLNDAEADYVVYRLKELAMNPLPGEYNTEHLLRMHHYIFQDLYEWAGEPRIIAIYKEEDVLGGLEPQKALNQKDRFFSMTKRELVIDGKIRLRLPPAGLRVFDIAGADLVKLRLAHVVQQRTDGKALLAVALGEKGVVQRVVDIQAVHAQPALAGSVEPGGCRCREEIRLVVQPVQQLFAAGLYFYIPSGFRTSQE